MNQALEANSQSDTCYEGGAFPPLPLSEGKVMNSYEKTSDTTPYGHARSAGAGWRVSDGLRHARPAEYRSGLICC